MDSTWKQLLVLLTARTTGEGLSIMPQPTLRARPKCCPVHQFLSPSRVCEDKKPPHRYCHHATCQLKGSEWPAPGYSHIHTNQETLQPKKSSSANAGTRNKATGLTWKIDLNHRTHSGWFTPLHRASINYLSGALLYSQNKSMCRRARRLPGRMQFINTHSHTREKEQRDPTWLKHTLEIKDDQNKGSQTSGKYHPAYPAHPHQFAQSLFHGGTERLEDAARFVREWRAGLSEAPGLWRYWWGLSAGQWAEHIQHGAYHFWAKRGVVRPRSEWARPRVHLNLWA